MVDARMLEHLSKKELEKFLGVTRKFHQASIVHGIHLLRMMKYDRQVSTSGKALSYSDFNLFCALGLKVHSQIVRVRCSLDLTPVGIEKSLPFVLVSTSKSLCPPTAAASFSTALLRVRQCLPLFYAPWGFHSRTFVLMSVSAFLKVCPSHLHVFLYL